MPVDALRVGTRGDAEPLGGLDVRFALEESPEGYACARVEGADVGVDEVAECRDLGRVRLVRR